MKDEIDTSTGELLNETKRRGRPRKPGALTPAQRKRAQRERDAAAVWAPAGAGGKAESDMTVSALLEQLRAAVARGRDAIARGLADELVRRAELNAAVTVANNAAVVNAPARVMYAGYYTFERKGGRSSRFYLMNPRGRSYETAITPDPAFAKRYDSEAAAVAAIKRYCAYGCFVSLCTYLFSAEKVEV